MSVERIKMLVDIVAELNEHIETNSESGSVPVVELMTNGSSFVVNYLGFQVYCTEDEDEDTHDVPVAVVRERIAIAINGELHSIQKYNTIGLWEL